MKELDRIADAIKKSMGLDKKLAALHDELDAVGAPRDESDVERLVRERVDAFRSSSPDLIRAFCHRWGIKWPSSDAAFLVRVHRHRSWAHSGLSEEERDYSSRWLDDRAHELGELFWDESRGLELERRVANR